MHIRVEKDLRKPDFPVEEYAHPIDVSHADFLIGTAFLFESIYEQRTLFIGKERGILREARKNEECEGSIRNTEASF